MNFTMEVVDAAVPVGILTTHGDIDASNYLALINAAQKMYQQGTRHLLLNLEDSPFMSSSGLVALHSIALMLKGEQPLDIENGWEALRSMSNGFEGGQTHLKLLNPQPRVDKTLDRSGLKPFFEIFTDRETALASFQPEKTAPTAM